MVRLFVHALLLLVGSSLAIAQRPEIPDDIPLDKGTRDYLESLPPDELAAVLEVYQEAFAGQVPAPPELITQQELSLYGKSPAVYPSPLAKGTGTWADAYAHVKALVNQMTNEEKANTTSLSDSGVPAIPRLGFPGLRLHDGPNGLNALEEVTAYASGITVGASWNKDLAHARGQSMGKGARRKGATCWDRLLVRLAGQRPGGRNWESFSVDPYLCGQMGAKTVLGIQENVIATAKHFVLNEQETDRNPSMFGFSNASVSSNIDDKTMHEYYLWPFQDAVKAGVGSVMCSYQRVNGSHSCQNSWTQNGLLKTELGFQGYIISDYNARWGGIASTQAGMDLVTPPSAVWPQNLTIAVENGTLAESRLDDMVIRILTSWFKFAQFDPANPLGLPPNISKAHEGSSSIDPSPEAKYIIRQGAVEGAVLVKNVNNTLPLKKPKILSLFGYDAHAPLVNSPTGVNSKYSIGYQSVNRTKVQVQGLFVGVGECPSAATLGTLVGGGGSGSVTPQYINSPFDAFQQRAYEDGTFLYWDFDSEDPSYSESDACLVFINEFASEIVDRVSLADQYSDNLVMNVAKKCRNTIVSIHNAGVRLVDRWIDHPNVTAVIFAHLPGQDAGPALVDIMYGEQAPSGKLPYTVAKNESDYSEELLWPVRPDNSSNYYTHADFTEGSYIDYRRFDALNIEPRFEFGFGLTYTTFNYSDLEVRHTEANSSFYPPPGEVMEGGLESLWDVVAIVTARVSNTGEVTASEIPQLYVGIPGAPIKQLRGFEKIPLHPKEGKSVSFPLTRRDLSLWDTESQSWYLERGEYKLYVGSSSRDIRLTGSLTF
ncbi:hypothetical protein AnigIFM49718_010786 [Aspergillus niger]|nr:hypothetical protein AnigIFM49718_010786 [Aspergillus niger]